MSNFVTKCRIFEYLEEGGFIDCFVVPAQAGPQVTSYIYLDSSLHGNDDIG